MIIILILGAIIGFILLMMAMAMVEARQQYPYID